MGSPATADEADDSYRTPGVGRSLPNSHDTKQQSCPNGREGRAGDHAWSTEEHWLRALPTNQGFTISVTAATEHVFRSSSEHQP